MCRVAAKTLEFTTVLLRALLIYELGVVPLSKKGAELLFEGFSERHEWSSIPVTSDLPFNDWTELFGSKRQTGPLPKCLSHHVHILEMNGDSYWHEQSRAKQETGAS